MGRWKEETLNLGQLLPITLVNQAGQSVHELDFESKYVTNHKLPINYQIARI